MATSGLGWRKKALVGTGWAISLLLCMCGLTKHTFGLVGPPFLTISFCFSVCMVSHWLRAVSWELVNEWVWFESWIYREWLQGQLGEVLSIITHIEGNWECNSCTLKDPTSSKWVLEIVLLLIGHEIFMCHYQLNLLSTSTVRVYLQNFATLECDHEVSSEGIRRCTSCAGHTCRPWQIWA